MTLEEKKEVIRKYCDTIHYCKDCILHKDANFCYNETEQNIESNYKKISEVK